MILILMGVSGSGKTTIGKRLAAELGWTFHDGDAFHPPANLVKMQSGVPLDDNDRAAWLAALRALIDEALGAQRSMVLACSALKQAYRERLQADSSAVRFVFLKGDFELIARRLQTRKGHFMPPHLLRSQFEALEEPEGVLTVNIASPPKRIVAHIKKALALK
jgi:gluconokinase